MFLGKFRECLVTGKRHNSVSTLNHISTFKKLNVLSCLSLWCFCDLGCTRFVWVLWMPLAGMGLDSKQDSPFLPFCWGFSFALGCGVCLQSLFSTLQPPLQCLLSCWDSSQYCAWVFPVRYGSAVACCRGSGCSRPGYGISPLGGGCH